MIGDYLRWKEIIMQLKLTTEYAIRIALYLAEQNGVCTSKEIAEYTQISPNYVLKILRILAKVNLVQNHIGIYGGFSLCKHPQDITLWDIVSVIESTIKISYCLDQSVEESKDGYKTVRSMYNFYHDLQDEIEDRFSRKILEQLLNENSNIGKFQS